MAEYQLNEGGGVILKAYNMVIPEEPRNRNWREYQQWLAEGNTPDPVPAPPAPSNQELLDASDQKMIRALDWLLEFVVTEQRLPTLADIPNQLKQLYQERKALRQSLP